jgi:hypothetical protein
LDWMCSTPVFTICAYTALLPDINALWLRPVPSGSSTG